MNDVLLTPGQAPAMMRPKPTLADVIIDRISAGATLEETKEYYKFLREIEADEARARAKAAYDRDRSLLEIELNPIATDAANPQTKSKYATLSQVVRAIRPIYSKHGIVVDFDTTESPKGEAWLRIVAAVQHAGGHSFTRHLDMPADGKGAQGRDVMTRTHATGSAVTYGRRYLLLMLFNLAVGGEDDDGNAAPNGKPNPQSSDEFFINEQQAAELERQIALTGRPVDLFCKKAKIEAIDKLPASRYADVLAFLANYIPKDEK